MATRCIGIVCNDPFIQPNETKHRAFEIQQTLTICIVNYLIFFSEESIVRMCIAQCLDLIPTKNKCEFSRSSGNGNFLVLLKAVRIGFLTAVGDKCAKEFFPAKEGKFVLCEYPLNNKHYDESKM
jgi:hypothetical protein